MQQCQNGALILMSAHFAQRGRKPVNLNFQWRGGSLRQQTPAHRLKGNPSADGRQRQSVPSCIRASTDWSVIPHIQEFFNQSTTPNIAPLVRRKKKHWLKKNKDFIGCACPNILVKNDFFFCCRKQKRKKSIFIVVWPVGIGSILWPQARNTWYGKVFSKKYCLFKSLLLPSGSTVDKITQRSPRPREAKPTLTHFFSNKGDTSWMRDQADGARSLSHLSSASSAWSARR